jgi:hypothetical protein
MADSLLGYGFCGIGFLSILCSFDKINAFVVKLAPVVSSFPDLYFQIAGGAFVMLGVFLLTGKNKKSKVLSEVPIYKGNQVVGYRREK